MGAPIPVQGKAGFDPDHDHDPGARPWASGDEVGLPASVAEAAATITSPAHLNVSVFRKKGRSATAVTAQEVDA